MLSSLLMTAHSSSSSPKDRMGAFFFFAPFAAAGASAGAFAASAMGRFPARDCDGFAGGPIAGPIAGPIDGPIAGPIDGPPPSPSSATAARPSAVASRCARFSSSRQRALRVFRLSRHRARRRSRVRPSCFCAAGRLFGAARPAPPPGSPRAPPCAARSRLCASGPWGWRRRDERARGFQARFLAREVQRRDPIHRLRANLRAGGHQELHGVRLENAGGSGRSRSFGTARSARDREARERRRATTKRREGHRSGDPPVPPTRPCAEPSACACPCRPLHPRRLPSRRAQRGRRRARRRAGLTNAGASSAIVHATLRLRAMKPPPIQVYK